MKQDVIDFLTYKLINTDKISFTVYQLISLVIAFFLTGIVLKVIRKVLTRKLPPEDKNKFISIFQFAKYVIYVLVFLEC